MSGGISRASSMYQKPKWGKNPNCQEFGLEVCRNGSVLENIKLIEKDHFLFGRDQRICDQVLKHPSISRQHAVIQFGENDDLYICDLGSSHGTSVNHSQIAAKTYQPLKVGHVIKFGQSTRFYHVTGPERFMEEEIETEAMKKEREALKKKEEEEKKKEKEIAEKRNALHKVTWGFGADAQVEEEVKPREEIDEEKLNEKDRELFDTLRKRRKKIENLENELARVRTSDRAREGVAENIERKITRIQEQCEELEDQLHRRNAARAGQGKKNEDQSIFLDDSDEDDNFYDRTSADSDGSGKEKKKKDSKKWTFGGGVVGSSKKGVVVRRGVKKRQSEKSSSTETIATYESLLKQQKFFIAEQAIVDKNLKALASKYGENCEKPIAQSDDPLESFMLETEHKRAVDQVKALKERTIELKDELHKLEGLIELTRPALTKGGNSPSMMIEITGGDKEKEKHEGDGDDSKNKKILLKQTESKKITKKTDTISVEDKAKGIHKLSSDGGISSLRKGVGSSRIEVVSKRMNQIRKHKHLVGKMAIKISNSTLSSLSSKTKPVIAPPPAFNSNFPKPPAFNESGKDDKDKNDKTTESENESGGNTPKIPATPPPSPAESGSNLNNLKQELLKSLAEKVNEEKERELKVKNEGIIDVKQSDVRQKQKQKEEQHELQEEEEEEDSGLMTKEGSPELKGITPDISDPFPSEMYRLIRATSPKTSPIIGPSSSPSKISDNNNNNNNNNGSSNTDECIPQLSISPKRGMRGGAIDEMVLSPSANRVMSLRPGKLSPLTMPSSKLSGTSPLKGKIPSPMNASPSSLLFHKHKPVGAPPGPIESLVSGRRIVKDGNAIVLTKRSLSAMSPKSLRSSTSIPGTGQLISPAPITPEEPSLKKAKTS